MKHWIGKKKRRMIYERDNYTCYLCNQLVYDRNLCGLGFIIENSLYTLEATLDHIIPRSKGGGHEVENLKTCCLLCNSIKNNKI